MQLSNLFSYANVIKFLQYLKVDFFHFLWVNKHQIEIHEDAKKLLLNQLNFLPKKKKTCIWIKMSNTNPPVHIAFVLKSLI